MNTAMICLLVYFAELDTGANSESLLEGRAI